VHEHAWALGRGVCQGVDPTKTKKLALQIYRPIPESIAKLITCRYRQKPPRILPWPKYVHESIIDSFECQLIIFMSKYLSHSSYFYPEFTQVGSTSFANLMPMLTGRRAVTEQSDMPAELPNLEGKRCDNLPLIWRQFATKGYATTFNEGNWGHGTFHHPLGGFTGQPTTFFYRNFWRKVEEVRNRRQGRAFPHCLNRQKVFQLHLDLTRRHLVGLENVSTFSVHYLVDPTHDNVELTGALDFGYRQLFRDMFEGGHFNRSFIIFSSDHGHRLLFLCVYHALPVWFKFSTEVVKSS